MKRGISGRGNPLPHQRLLRHYRASQRQGEGVPRNDRKRVSVLASSLCVIASPDLSGRGNPLPHQRLLRHYRASQ
ncbi:MAG: hypothetical protein WBE46_07160 [Dehalococcoidia bacterium]